jgi:hypothetical protein
MGSNNLPRKMGCNQFPKRMGSNIITISTTILMLRQMTIKEIKTTHLRTKDKDMDNPIANIHNCHTKRR